MVMGFGIYRRRTATATAVGPPPARGEEEAAVDGQPQDETGTSRMAKKRKSTGREAAAAATAIAEEGRTQDDRNLKAECKRQKTAICKIAEQFACPISTELPIDPVVAEDGRTYNRASIQSHIDRAKKSDTDLKSPVTKEPMGTKLVPAVQIRNSIRALIESGVIEGDGADRWKEVDDIMVRVEEEADPDAMVLLGNEYLTGSEGFILDKEQGYKWYVEAARLGSTRGMAHQAWCLFYGEGVATSKAEGAVLLASAAERGSEFAAYYLGFEFYQGIDGLPKNLDQAKYWLKKVVEGGYQGHMQEEDFEEAKNILKEIEGETNALV